MRKLGLVAGGGALPISLAEHCRAQGRPYYVVRLRGFADPALLAHEGGEAGVAEVGRVVRLARNAGCEALCFAGFVRRPDFAALKPDLRGIALLPGAAMAARKGDEGLLRFLMAAFEKEGFAIEGAHEVMGELALGEGPLGRLAPAAAHADDIAKALKVAAAIGALDIGQGAVVCDGLVLAVEAQEGTDAMLARVAGLAPDLIGAASRRRGVLAKVAKPIQEARVDLPTVGVATVEGAARAGLAGIVGLADKALVVDRAAVIEAADRLGLFVAGVAE
ncbi:MAG: UDP-2,3-diacylglucosamine diphosphatase [Caulobacteraceae bacterium]